jgi:hypothetical protein
MARPNPPAIRAEDNHASGITIIMTEGYNGGVNIYGYRVYWNMGVPGAPAVGSLDTNTDRIVFTGLPSGQEYFFWAIARNIDGDSNPSASAYVEIASPPDPPGAPVIGTVTDTSVRLTWGGNGDSHGVPFVSNDEGEFWGSPDTTPRTIIHDVKSYTWTGLTPGTRYYFWAKNHTAGGWSGFSARSTVVTHRVPDAPSAITFSNIRQASLTAKFSINGDGGSPFTGHEIGYSKTSTGTKTIVPSDGLTDLPNLPAGVTLYFWARSKNKYGSGPWSAVRSVRMLAGARVNVNGAWVQAVPYVNVNGNWRVAEPWSKIAGVWKETL